MSKKIKLEVSAGELMDLKVAVRLRWESAEENAHLSPYDARQAKRWRVLLEKLERAS